MSRLTKVEKHYILTSGKEIKEIAEDLGRAVKTVQKFYDENYIEPTQAETPEEPLQNPAELKGQSNYDPKTGLAKKDGVVIMTQTGAEKGDSSRKKNKLNKGRQRTDCIHKL